VLRLPGKIAVRIIARSIYSYLRNNYDNSFCLVRSTDWLKAAAALRVRIYKNLGSVITTGHELYKRCRILYCKVPVQHPLENDNIYILKFVAAMFDRLRIYLKTIT